MTAPTLFDPAPLQVRADPLPTTVAAVKRDQVTLLERVRSALAAHPAGLTDWELTQVLGEPERRKPSVAKRRGECGAVPALYAGTSDHVTRKTPLGCEAIVWVLA